MLLAGRNTLESCLSVCAQKLTNRGDLAMNSLEVVLQGAVSTHLADVGLVLFGNLEPPLQRFCLDGKVWGGAKLQRQEATIQDWFNAKCEMKAAELLESI